MRKEKAMHEEMETMKSTWLLVCGGGVKYTVCVDSFSNWKGGSLHGEYSLDGVSRGRGCFPLCDIDKMTKVG
jgi:hypothetical protein